MMIGAISSLNSYYGIYRSPRLYSSMAEPVQRTQAAAAMQGTQVLHRAADLETPVQPIQPILPVNPDAAGAAVTDNSAWFRNQMAEMAVRMRIQYVDSSGLGMSKEAAGGINSLQKSGESERCETCEKRKYQDGSDDPSVSYQTPTRIDPDTAASAVRSHEMEHVAHEQSKAQQEDRKVVSQSVTLHTNICPECGRVFVSGGTTRTVTKENTDPEEFLPENSLKNQKAA